MIIVVLGLSASACGGPSRTPRTTTTTTARSTTTTAPRTTTTSSPSTTTVPRPTAPVGTAVPGGFQPGSVTFVSATTGFVIGIDATCAAGSCVALARTTDRGSTWVALPAPSAAYVGRGLQAQANVAAVSEVRFADELDGWIYGPSLFATHDGGATWQQVSLGGSVISLEASGGYVDAVVSTCSGEQECTGPLTLYQAPATGGTFTVVMTGPSTLSDGQVSTHLALHAPAGFVDMTGLGTPNQSIFATESLASGKGWNSFADPCAVTSGYALDTFVAPDATSLESLCSGQGAAGSVEKEVVRTVNGTSAVAGAPPPGGDPEGLAATSSGTLIVSAASGATSLYRSTDGGATWTTAATFPDGGIGFNDLGFTTETQGIVVHGYPGPPNDFASQLLMTTDGGATWAAVPIT